MDEPIGFVMYEQVGVSLVNASAVERIEFTSLVCECPSHEAFCRLIIECTEPECVARMVHSE